PQAWRADNSIRRAVPLCAASLFRWPSSSEREWQANHRRPEQFAPAFSLRGSTENSAAIQSSNLT
ncbi:MAG: hypothetical protein WCC73_14650, partial [Terracidiphilus sp.]